MLKKSFITSIAIATFLTTTAPSFAGGVRDMGPRRPAPVPAPVYYPADTGGMPTETPTEAIYTAESSLPWIALGLFAVGVTAALIAGLSGHSKATPSTPVVVDGN